MGSVEEDGVSSVGRSGRVMTRLKPENPVAWGCCKLADAVDETNKLANALLLVVPLLLELVLLLQLAFRPVAAGGASSKI